MNVKKPTLEHKVSKHVERVMECVIVFHEDHTPKVTNLAKSVMNDVMMSFWYMCVDESTYFV